MRQVVISVFIALSFTFSALGLAQAANAAPQAPTLDEVLAAATKSEANPPIFIERGRSHGFYSTDSCLYLNPQTDTLILEDYCFPQRKYPARGVTLISRAIGIVKMYDENFASGTFRSFRQVNFPEDLVKALGNTEIANLRIADLNKLYEHFTANKAPTCWSNASQGVNMGSGADCLYTEIANLPNWSVETSNLTTDTLAWHTFFRAALPHFLD